MLQTPKFVLLKKTIIARKAQWFSLTNLGIAQAAGIVIGILTSSMMARAFSLEIFGYYQLIISIMSIAGTIGLQGLNHSLKISAAKRYDGNLTKILKPVVITNIIGSLAVLAVSFYYRSQEQTMLANGLLIAAFFFPFRLEIYYTAWLQGRGQLRLSAFLEVLALLVSLLTLFLFVLAGFTTLAALLVAMLGMPALVTMWSLSYILRQRENHILNEVAVKFGWHVSMATMLGAMINADKLILDRYFSVTDVAIYSIAMIFPHHGKKLYLVFDQYMTPHLYKAQSVTAGWNYLRNKFVWLLLIFLLVGIVGYFMLPYIIPFLFSAEYLYSVPYAQWMWFSLMASAPFTYMANILRAQQKAAFEYGVSILTPVGTVLLYLVLIPYGIWGIVIARIIMNWGNSLMQVFGFWFYLKREQRLS